MSLAPLNDTTDTKGIRHVMIQTAATGDNKAGYKAAELQAHQWFFANYDRTARRLLKNGGNPVSVTEVAVQIGDLDLSWLGCPHPIIVSGRRKFMFGHHVGINPTATEPTWGFQFENPAVGSFQLN